MSVAQRIGQPQQLLGALAIAAEDDHAGRIGVAEEAALVLAQLEARRRRRSPPASVLAYCATKQFSPAAFSVWHACLASAGEAALGAQPDPARERHDQLGHRRDAREARRKRGPRALRLRLVGEGAELDHAAGRAGRLRLGAGSAVASLGSSRRLAWAAGFARLGDRRLGHLAEVELRVLVLARAGLERGLAFAGDVEPAGVGRLDLVGAGLGAGSARAGRRRRCRGGRARRRSPATSAAASSTTSSAASILRAEMPRGSSSSSTACSHGSWPRHRPSDRRSPLDGLPGAGQADHRAAEADLLHALAQHLGMGLRGRADLEAVEIAAVANCGAGTTVAGRRARAPGRRAIMCRQPSLACWREPNAPICTSRPLAPCDTRDGHRRSGVGRRARLAGALAPVALAAVALRLGCADAARVNRHASAAGANARARRRRGTGTRRRRRPARPRACDRARPAAARLAARAAATGGRLRQRAWSIAGGRASVALRWPSQ